jgi:hypothetical protein
LRTVITEIDGGKGSANSIDGAFRVAVVDLRDCRCIKLKKKRCVFLTPTARQPFDCNKAP